MRFTLKNMKATVLLLLAYCLPGMCLAQEMVFSTRPAAKKVGIQDRFEVRYTIQNARVQRFSLPPLPDFEVVGGPMQSQSTSYVNGERSTSIELTYIFRAKRKGTLTIPGGIAVMEGKSYRSNDVQIEVVEGSVAQQQSQGNRGRSPFDDPFFDDPFGGSDPFAAMQQQHQQMMNQLRQMQQAFGAVPPSSRNMQPAPRMEAVGKEDIDKNIFIRVEVDKKQVALGEQVTAVYKLYSRLPMQVNLTKLPSLIGFWSQDFKISQPPKPTREVLDGKEYQVFVLKKSALFPTQTGTLQLDPAEAEGAVKVLSTRKVKQHNPFDDFFGGSLADAFVSAYGYEDVPVKLKSLPVPIQVSALPEKDKPASFKGAVGNYTLECNIDKTELTTDESAVLTLRVSGTGNLKLIEEPSFQFPDDLDHFDPQVFDTINNNHNIIAGYKSFTYTLSPKVPGIFTIPATEFSYFDPGSNSYKTLSTPSYTLHVKPGKSTAGIRTVLPRDIHDIDSHSGDVDVCHSFNLPASPWYWSGFAIPACAYIFLLAFRKREEKLQQNTILFRNKRANKVALRRLSLAEKFLQQQAQNSFYEETSKAVWLYLSDKLAIPLSALSKEMAADKLRMKQIPEHTLSEVFRITDECELALYSPESGSLKMKQTYGDTLRLIGKLEEHLS